MTKATLQIFSELSGEKQTVRCTHRFCGSEFRQGTAGTAGLCFMLSGVSSGKVEGWSWNPLKAYASVYLRVDGGCWLGPQCLSVDGAGKIAVAFWKKTYNLSQMLRQMETQKMALGPSSFNPHS